MARSMIEVTESRMGIFVVVDNTEIMRGIRES